MQTGSRRRRHRTIDTVDYLRMVARVVATGGQRVADGDLEEFRQLLELRKVLDAAILDAVRGLRAAEITWDEIGGVSGHTRQAAIKKWNADL